MQAITLTAQISKIQSTADGGYKLTIELGNEDTKAVKELLEYNGRPQLFAVALTPFETYKEYDIIPTELGS